MTLVLNRCIGAIGRTADSEATFPKIDGELDNRPGKRTLRALEQTTDYSYHKPDRVLVGQVF